MTIRDVTRALLGVVLLAGGAAAADRSSADWTPADPDRTWSFPADHYPHPETSIEWWYFTGLVEDVADPSVRFGYQFTFFRVGLTPGDDAAAPGASRWRARDAIMGHAAVTDLSTGEHRFSELFRRAAPIVAGFGDGGSDLVAWSRAPAGTDDRWELRWNGTGFEFTARDDAAGVTFSFTTTPARPLVFQGENGYSPKDADGAAASSYYSFTRLDTTGSVTLDGRPRAVRGTSWMDHEFSSSQLNERQVGWDWFSLRLEDGRDLMLYVLRRADGSVDHARGTLVEADGRARILGVDDWSLRAEGTWTSPESGARYPSGWRIEVPSAALELVVRPYVEAAENVSRRLENLHYWEGAVEVEAGGARVGEGFVELTGYGDDARLPL